MQLIYLCKDYGCTIMMNKNYDQNLREKKTEDKTQIDDSLTDRMPTYMARRVLSVSFHWRLHADFSHQ